MPAKRNRIVIGIGGGAAWPAPARAARRRSRAGRVFGFIAIILVVVVVGIAGGGYFWWQHYKSQPGYSLALLVDAAQRDDRKSMDQLLDIDKITASFVAQARQRTGGSYSPAIAALMPSQIEQLAARLTPRVKQTIHDQLPAEIQRLSAPAAGKPFALIAIAVPYFFSVKQDGNSAQAIAKINNEQISLTMHQGASGQWQIVAIEDDRLAGIIADTVRKGLSPTGSQMQDLVPRPGKPVILQ